MPKLGGFQTKRVSLPSYPKDAPAWALINLEISLETWIKAKDMENWDRTIAVITNVIVDWNLEDKDGKKAEINEENVSKLTVKDLDAIMKELSFMGGKLTKAEKKS